VPPSELNVLVFFGIVEGCTYTLPSFNSEASIDWQVHKYGVRIQK